MGDVHGVYNCLMHLDQRQVIFEGYPHPQMHPLNSLKYHDNSFFHIMVNISHN